MPPSTYCVVEFLAVPRPDVDKYVCVPNRWIRWNDKSNSTVGVAYPEGHPAEIEHLARMNHDDPDFWIAYGAFVKFRTSSYQQAMNYLRVLREMESLTTGSTVPTSQRRFSEGPSRLRPTATTSNSGGIGANNKTYDRPFIVNVSTRAPMHQTRSQQTLQSSAGTANHSSVSATHYPVRDVQATQNVSHGCQRLGSTSDHAFCASKFETVLGSVQANIQKLVEWFNHLATINVKNNEKLTEVNARMKDYQVWRRTVESQLSARPSMREMPRKIKNEFILIVDDDDDDDDDDESNDVNSTIPNQVITTQDTGRVQRRRIAEFTLPPEYNPRDSRWTLRYRSLGPILTELMPRSRIYVNILKLNHCCMTARDCKSLARLLMVEVFSDNALKVCSFTGKRCSHYSPESPVRPGLDKNARNTLVKYVEKFGRQKGWRMDVPAINTTMRFRLENCRRKAKTRN